MSGVWLLVCRRCGGGVEPIPFASPAERGRWAAAHTRGTGHDRWWVHDGDVPPAAVAAAIAEHDAAVAAVVAPSALGTHPRRANETAVSLGPLLSSDQHQQEGTTHDQQ